MLTDHPIHTALPVVDLERARRFYTEKLGLTPESEMLGGLFYRCGENSRFLLFPSQGKALGSHTRRAGSSIISRPKWPHSKTGVSSLKSTIHHRSRPCRVLQSPGQLRGPGLKIAKAIFSG